MAYDNLKLEKSFYGSPKGFAGALESADPTEQYRGTALGELDAYERQLKRFGIHVSGAGSDRVEKFFQTAETATLFPEYIARAVRRGMERADVLPRITATTTQFSGVDYRSIETAAGTGDPQAAIGEAAQLPETLVRNKTVLTTLKKHGRLLSASYEAIRFHRLELLTVALRQIGAEIAKTVLADAVVVLSGNAQSVDMAGAAPVYNDLLSVWNSMEPFALTTLLAPAAQMQQLLALPELRDAAAGLNFHGSGQMVTPLGAELIKSDAVPAGSILALDKNAALEMVTAGGIVTDYDKLIDRQLERAAITTTVGFAKIHAGAVKVLA
ncbi:MAG: phage major capsid protein [Oscillospiraceae bacterium]|jgi:hypothetical protein|nr:phage major capsid protein [Oscillospiraceae bacterium]